MTAPDSVIEGKEEVTADEEFCHICCALHHPAPFCGVRDDGNWSCVDEDLGDVCSSCGKLICPMCMAMLDIVCDC